MELEAGVGGKGREGSTEPGEASWQICTGEMLLSSLTGESYQLSACPVVLLNEVKMEGGWAPDSAETWRDPECLLSCLFMVFQELFADPFPPVLLPKVCLLDSAPTQTDTHTKAP